MWTNSLALVAIALAACETGGEGAHYSVAFAEHVSDSDLLDALGGLGVDVDVIYIQTASGVGMTRNTDELDLSALLADVRDIPADTVDREARSVAVRVCTALDPRGDMPAVAKDEMAVVVASTLLESERRRLQHRQAIMSGDAIIYGLDIEVPDAATFTQRMAARFPDADVRRARRVLTRGGLEWIANQPMPPDEVDGVPIDRDLPPSEARRQLGAYRDARGIDCDAVLGEFAR